MREAEATRPPPVPEAPRPTQPRPAPSPGLVRLLLVTTAIFFVTTVLFGLMAFRPQSAPINTSTTRAAADAQEEQAIEGLADRFSNNLITFDHRSLDRDMERIVADGTENFRTQFHTALGGDINVFRQTIADAEAQSSGEVKGTSISSRDDEAATVFVFVQQTVRSRERPEPRTQLRLLELALVNTDGSWKVDNVANPARPAQ